MQKQLKKVTVGKFYRLRDYSNLYGYSYFNRLMFAGWRDEKPKKCLYAVGDRIKFEGIEGGIWEYDLRDLVELSDKEAKKYLTKIKDEVYFGIEIESLFRYTKLNFEVGGYHSGFKINNFWESQSDSSIRPNHNHNSYYDEDDFDDDDDDNYCEDCDCYSCDCFERSDREINNYTFRGVEFVSKKINGLVDFDNTLKNFKEINNSIELGKDLYFNNSCGCHIHIGFNKGRKIRDKLTFDRLKKVRDTFFKLVDESVILSDDTKQKVKDNYFRNYAQKINLEDWLNSSLRSAEFNLDNENLGLEWRSFNICGVKSWDEFFEMFEIAKKSLSHLIRDRLKGYRTRKKSFKIGKEVLKKISSQEKQEIKIKNHKQKIIINNNKIMNFIKLA